MQSSSDYIRISECPALTHAKPFEQGRLVRHRDGTVVRFSDDRWIVQTADGAKNHVSIGFAALPAWIRIYAKRYVAREWLAAGKSPATLKAIQTALARGVEALRPFNGPSLSDLTPDHADRVNSWLEERWRKGQVALTDATREKGGTLAPREARAVLRSVGGLGPKAIGNTVHRLNQVLDIARQDGLEIDCQFRRPRDVRQTIRKAGGADPLKVLTDDELAAVIDAAQQDIDEYHEVCAEVHAAEASLGMRMKRLRRIPTLKSRGDVVYHRLARYLGIDGYEMTGMKQLARDEGVTSAGFGRTLRGYLVKVLGQENAGRIWSLRSRLPRQGISITPEEREAAQEELNRILDEIDLSGLRALRGPKTAVKPTKRETITREDDQKVVSRIRRLRARIPTLHTRAIKACALQLLAVTFRRVSAPLLSLAAEPETRWVEHRGERLFGVQITSFKMWGDSGLPEWVELPGFHGEAAERAIRTAQKLTAELRPVADQGAQDHLFIIPFRRSYKRAVALSSKVLHEYVYTNIKGKDSGVLRRRSVPRAEEISLHFFRHTHITALISETGNPILAARIAGNSPEQALTAYFSMGTREARLQARKFAERGAATGFLWDAVMRVKMEAEGAVDESVPSGQLSLDEALRRLRENPEFLGDYLQGAETPTPESVRRFLDRGLVVNLTSKGACILPVEEGPCPASEDL